MTATVNYVGMDKPVDANDPDVVEQMDTMISLMITEDMETGAIRMWTRKMHLAGTLGELEQVDIDLHTALGM